MGVGLVMDVRDYGLRKMYVEKRKTPAGDVGWGLRVMLLLRGEDVSVASRAVLRRSKNGRPSFFAWMLRMNHTEGLIDAWKAHRSTIRHRPTRFALEHSVTRAKHIVFLSMYSP